ncbi:7TM diverse intracellular signaling domain-containing protein [Flammeovirga sp. OC4]|uniref:7TM diverse intracellular signaling domain-containing protein n=1 Tax=Flammeovirga sp. OC4 TaxID=1382345 RepID=UPI0009E4ED27|nr:7TM diverse intracellular signaling domain-containing protein [Flammeovirga sp. OC4]
MFLPARFTYLILLFLIVSSSSTYARSHTFENIGTKVMILEDASHSISEMDVISGNKDHLFKFYNQEIPNFQSTKSSYWVKFETNVLDAEHNYIEVGSAFLDTLHFYEVSKEGLLLKTVKTGDAYNFSTREIDMGNFVFRLTEPQNSTIYLKVSALQPLFFPLRAGTITDFIAFEHDFDFYQGIYFGFMLLMFFYNFFVWYSTRDNIYLVYVCYVLSITVFMAAVFGYMFEYLWPETPIINEFVVISSAFTQITAVIFTKKFIQGDTLPPIIKKGFTLYIIWGFIIIASIILDFKVEALMMSQVGLLTLGFLLLIASLISYKRGYKPAKYYLIAWGALNAGFIAAILESVNVLEVSMYLNPMQIGSGIEVLFLSFALGDKLKTLKEEKERAQLEVLEALQKNETLIKEQNVMLERRVTQRTHELSEANTELTALTEELSTTLETVKMQSNIIEKAHENTKASINYAKRIQDAMLPNTNQLKKVLKDMFIFYKPRDIVSGDFYWSHEKDGIIYLAACDCTGHGVPGGFLSMLGNEVLTEIVSLEGVSDPKDILLEADKRISEILKQKMNTNMDGMDVSLVRIDKKKGELTFAGAKNPLVYVKNGEVTKVKGDSYSIGGNYKKTTAQFKSHVIPTKDTKFYLFSDGYQDQTGGGDNKKFMVRKFRELLRDTSLSATMEDQKSKIISTLEKWMSQEDHFTAQVDDILVVGFEV